MSTAHIKLRGGTAADWTSENPILLAREPGIETDTGKIKFGDGTTAWNSLGYAGGGGPTVTGADTQVAVIDSSGNLVGDAGLKFDPATGTLEVRTDGAGFGGSGKAFVARMSDASPAMQIEQTFSGGVPYAIVSFGDVDQSRNVTYFQLADFGKTMIFSAPGGQATFGDPGYIVNGSQFLVDDASMLTSQNVDHYFTSDSIGDVYIDRADGVTAYRMFYDSGAGGWGAELA